MSILKNGELLLYGDVGFSFFDEGFTASDVVEALSQHGSQNAINVRINSGGGIATEGAAIYSILAAHKGKVTVEVEGIAASAASVIAMAGEEITMSLGSIMMVHDPAGYFFGYTEDDIDEAKDSLRAMGTTLSEIYAAKTGKTPEECRADMKKTLWLTPSEAVEAGYATQAGNDNAIEAAAFDYRTYANAPNKLVAMSTEKNWTLTASKIKAAPSAANITNTEEDMKPQEIKARIKAITTSPEAANRAELAEHLAFETELSIDDAIATLKTSPEAKPEGQDINTPSGYMESRLQATGLGTPNSINRPTVAKTLFSEVLKETNKGRSS